MTTAVGEGQFSLLHVHFGKSGWGIKEQNPARHWFQGPKQMPKELVVQMQPMQTPIFTKVSNTDFFLLCSGDQGSVSL